MKSVAKDIVLSLKEAYGREWITSRDGNISFRQAGNTDVLITPSGKLKFKLKTTDLVKADISRLTHTPNVSGEIKLHYMLQQHILLYDRVVLHLHPTYTIALMLTGFDLQKLQVMFPEVGRYTKIGPSIDYAAPLTADLAINTCNALGLGDDGSLLYNIVGQKQHGICSVGQTVQEAWEHCERLEHICKIFLVSGMSHSNI